MATPSMKLHTGGTTTPDAAHAVKSAPVSEPGAFDAAFEALFHVHFPRVFRLLDRLGGDAELAADLAQDAFTRLYRRGEVPERPEAWLITVALNLFRNARSTRARRHAALTPVRGTHAQSDVPPEPGAALDAERTRLRVRQTIDRLPERDRHLLLLHAEGYSYREIATALGLKDASVGTLLARARSTFSQCYREAFDAPRE